MISLTEPRNWSEAGQERIEVFFDGDCPLCRREVGFLKRRDRLDRIRATNIADPAFDASLYGRSQTEFMATIQGRLADGTWISGVEVFRQLYAAVGFSRLIRFSRLRPIAWLLDRAYALFAKHRLRLTGRCSNDACALPQGSNSHHSRSSSPREAIVTRSIVIRPPARAGKSLSVFNHNETPTNENRVVRPRPQRSERPAEQSRSLN